MSKSDVYSPYKAVLHKDKIMSIKKGELVFPVFVQWDLTNRCNANCCFCFYKNAGYNKHKMFLKNWDERAEMNVNAAFKIMDELKYCDVKAIEWTGGGEPTIHPNFKEIILKSKELGFENSLVTNGISFNDEIIDLVNDFEWVRFSIDASTEETYEKVKGVKSSNFKNVIENIKSLISKRKEGNIIGLSFIVCPENYKEIYSFAEMGKKLGVDNVRFSLAMTTEKENIFNGIWDEIAVMLDSARKLEDSNFKVFAFSNRINEIANKTYSNFCGYHHLCAVIAPGGVYPCCLLKDSVFNLGEPEKKCFVSIWLGEERKKFIKFIEKGCPFSCWMTEKNKFIEYLMNEKEDLRHVNFI